MNLRIQDAIVKTLCYADVFDYPLTLDEIGKWLIKFKIQKSRPKADQPWAEKIKIIPPQRDPASGGTIKNLKLIETIEGYYFLRGRENTVKERIKRKAWSEEKIKVARKAANILRFIPTILLVGVTGALAMENAKKDDDIDLFIITLKGSLWTTRFLATVLLELTGNRRRPQDTKVDNKICLNMFAAQDFLTVPENEQDLFSAHEVLQMKPISDRNHTYEKFLFANGWVRKYLPNAITSKNLEPRTKNLEQKKKFIVHSSSFIVRLPEAFIKRFQLWYMRKHRTTEVIREGIIRFHPDDARVWVMKKYRLRYSNALSSK